MLKGFLVGACTLFTVTAITLAPQQPSEVTKPTVILLIGPPGSGQGVLAVKVAKEFNLPHICAAELLHEELHQESLIGEKARECLNAKGFIPDELIFQMLAEKLMKHAGHHGFLLNGIPRTLEQAKELQKIIADAYDLMAISINVNDATLVERDSGRFICRDCGRVYHKQCSPPQKTGVCDRCEHPLVQRDDDTPEYVSKRLEEYHKITNPVLAFYRDEGILVEVNGNCGLDTTFEEIKEHYNHNSMLSQLAG